MSVPTSKRCSACKHQLPASDFYRSSNPKYPLSSYCKRCTRQGYRARQSAAPRRRASRAEAVDLEAWQERADARNEAAFAEIERVTAAAREGAC